MYLCIYVCTCACMNVCVCVCMYECTYLAVDAMCECIDVLMFLKGTAVV